MKKKGLSIQTIGIVLLLAVVSALIFRAYGFVINPEGKKYTDLIDLPYKGIESIVDNSSEPAYTPTPSPSTDDQTDSQDSDSNSGGSDGSDQNSNDESGQGDSKISVRIKAILDTSVDENEYRRFIEKIENYLNTQGIKIDLEVVDITTYMDKDPDDQDCCRSHNLGSDDSADLLMCVGPGEGWFWAKPVVGANTNPPFGFSDVGVRAEAHEILHFLGCSDEVYPPEMPKMGSDVNKENIDASVMHEYGRDDAKVSYVCREIANYNLKNLRASVEMKYPRCFDSHFSTIMPDEILLKFSDAKTRNIYEFFFNFEGGFDYQYVKECDEKECDVQVFNKRDGKWVWGYKIEEQSGNVYWIPYYLLEECWVESGFKNLEECTFLCEEAGKWCKLESWKVS